MGAYIINVPSTVDRIIYVHVDANGKTAVVSQQMEDLTPYTEPDLHEVRKKAYEKGYHDAAYNCHEGCNFLDDAKKKADEEYRRGYADCEAHYKAMVQDSDTTEGADAYQRGLADAWEATKKLALMDTETSENVTGYFGLFRIMENLTPMQAIEKIRQYEQEKEEQIQVGDEVTPRETEYDDMIVTRLWKDDYDSDCIDAIGFDGRIGSFLMSRVSKTGKHYEIATVLEKMRGEQDG